MTNLSPQAQAVLDAFDIASDGHYDDGVWVPHIRKQLAAALEAATDQAGLLALGAVALTVEDMVEQRIRRKLLAIAAELRGEEALAHPEPQGPTDKELLEAMPKSILKLPCKMIELRSRVKALEDGLTAVSLELRDRVEALEAAEPPSLKKQALADFNWLIGRTLGNPEVDERSKRILQALESLSND